VLLYLGLGGFVLKTPRKNRLIRDASRWETAIRLIELLAMLSVLYEDPF
jgi:hypothetical protein